MRKMIPLFIILALITGCATAPPRSSHPSAAAIIAQPTLVGFLGVAFEYDSDGAPVGAQLVKNPYTEKEQACTANNAMAVGETEIPPGHSFQTVCLPLLEPPNGRLTLIAVVNSWSGALGFVAVGAEFNRGVSGAAAVFRADLMGSAPDEANCIGTGKETIRSSIADHKIKHPLTIACLAVPPPASKTKGSGDTV